MGFILLESFPAPILIIFCIFIENAFKNKRNKVLVHCAAGVSRSATIVISYLMKLKKWSYFDTKKYVLKRRKVISPNPVIFSLNAGRSISQKHFKCW